MRRQVATTSRPPPLPPFLLSGSTPLVGGTGKFRPRHVSIPFCSLCAISGSFDLSFNILFNFPSQYFSAIGLCVIFRFSRNLPAALRCTHKQRDSKAGGDLDARVRGPGEYHPLCCRFPTDFPTHSRHLPPAQKEHRHAGFTSCAAFSFDLFPLPSPVLGKSLLFSFPPLNNMLKFSG